MAWYESHAALYGHPLAELPTDRLDAIAAQVEGVQSPSPMVTVSIIARNEETHLAACIASLAQQQCRFPMEIIGVDNDSTDRTAELFGRLGVPVFAEHNHSCGWARSCGLSHARGRFHINIDADTIYPPHYVEAMTEALLRPGTVAACGSWSYLPDADHSRLGLWFYELTRDLYLWLQHFRRPELAVRGLVFAYHTDTARRIGIRTDIIRGEDGSLALGLKQHGRIRFLHGSRTRAITGYGTLGQGLGRRFLQVVVMRLKSIPSLLTTKSHYEDQASNLIK